MKVGKEAALIVGIIMASLSAFAVDDTLSFAQCSSLKPLMACPSDSVLPLGEQKEVVVDMLMDGVKMPAHQKVSSWNLGLDVSVEPDGTLLSDSDNIQEAWVNITAVMPSVSVGSILHVNSSGLLRTDYGYELSRPNSYHNGEDVVCGSAGRTNDLDDCRTEYPSNIDESFLEVFNNGQNFSREKFANFTSSPDSFFESKLHIKNKILRQHWKWEESGCCKTCKAGEVEYCCAYAYSCNYVDEDYVADSLDLSASIKAEGADIPQRGWLHIFFDSYEQPVTGYLYISVDDLQSYTLKLGDAVLKKRFFSYDVNYSFAPYNFLSLEAVRNDEFFVDNLQVVSSGGSGGFETVVFETLRENLGSCQVTLEGFFFSATEKCYYTILSETSLSVDTDKFNYEHGDAIRASITLSSEGDFSSGYVDVLYGNQSDVVYVNGVGFTEFTADKQFNVVEVSFETDLNKSSAKTSKPIHVSSGVSLSFFLFLAVVLLLVFAFEKVWQRYVLQV